jgi:hypothetical protein
VAPETNKNEEKGEKGENPNKYLEFLQAKIAFLPD